MTLRSQVSLQPDNHLPVCGDIVNVERIILTEMETEDPSVLNIENSRIVNDGVISYNMHQSTDSTLLVKQSPLGITRYTIKGDSIFMDEYETRLSTLHYDRPVLDMTFPLSVGDTLSGFFFAKGRYCEDIPYLMMGRYKTRAMECCKLVLPDGDSLQNVLLVVQERLFINQQVQDFNSMKKVKALDDDSIAYHVANASHLQREVYCRWYADGYRYPVLESLRHEVSQNGEQTLLQDIAYYTPITAAFTYESVDNNLRSVNQVARMESFHNHNGRLSQHFTVNVIENGNILLNLSQEVSTSDGLIPYMVSTVDGGMVTCGRCQLDSSKSCVISLTNTVKGVYVVSAFIQGEWSTDKIVLK